MQGMSAVLCVKSYRASLKQDIATDLNPAFP